jgi:hypothetical protein
VTQLVHLSACVPNGKGHHTSWKLLSSWYVLLACSRNRHHQQAHNVFVAVTSGENTSIVGALDG